jgi:hypothetical protein
VTTTWAEPTAYAEAEAQLTSMCSHGSLGSIDVSCASASAYAVGSAHVVVTTYSSAVCPDWSCPNGLWCRGTAVFVPPVAAAAKLGIGSAYAVGSAHVVVTTYSSSSSSSTSFSRTSPRTTSAAKVLTREDRDVRPAEGGQDGVVRSGLI